MGALSKCAADAPSTGGTPRKGTSQAERAKGFINKADGEKDRAIRNAGILSISGGGGSAGSGDS